MGRIWREKFMIHILTGFAVIVFILIVNLSITAYDFYKDGKENDN